MKWSWPNQFLFFYHQMILSFSVKNLESAKKLLRSENFTIVLLDLGLPDGDGFSLIKEIKKFKKRRRLLIILSALKYV